MAGLLRRNCFLIAILLISEFAKENVKASPAGCYRFVEGELVLIKNCLTNHKAGPRSERSVRGYPFPSPNIQEALEEAQERQIAEYQKMQEEIKQRKRKEREERELQERMHGGEGRVGTILRAIGYFFSSIFD